jgi:threonine dehydratase
MSHRGTWPISLADVRRAHGRIRPHLPPTPLRRYGQLNDAVGQGIRVLVKHENHNPTNSFKVRNGLSVLTALSAAERRRGVVAGTRGNHGQGLAWAGRVLDIPVTLVVPQGNNPEKDAAMRALGAELVVAGSDYDDAVAVADRLSRERGLRVVHSTNDPEVLAGAATISIEILEEQHPDVDAMVISVGGGSQAVGAMTVARELRPGMEVYAVQASAAPTIHDSWHAGRPTCGPVGATIADGLATRETYELTFPALKEGLADFVTVSEVEIAEAIRLLLRATHNLAEGAGAAGLAGLVRLRERLAGKTVGIILGGGNIDTETLRRVLAGEL